jgi:hypothetical protein
MDSFIFLFAAVFIAAAAFLSAAVISYYRKSQKDFKESLASALSGLNWDETKNTFQCRGLNYRFEKHEGSKNSPPSFCLFLDCAWTGGEFDLWQESAWERFFKRIGMTREIQTGDGVFDGRCYIASGTPEFARDSFASPERREAARRLFDMKAESVTHGKQFMSVKWTGSLAHAQGAGRLKEAAEALAVLAKDLPLCRPAAASSETGADGTSRRFWVIGLAAASLAFGIVALIAANAMYPPFDPFRFFLFSLRFSVPASAIFLYYAARALAGNSRSHRDFMIAFFLALSGLILSGYGAAGLYNGGSDASAPAGHTVMIMDKRIQRSKNSKAYKLVARSWRPGHFTEELRTNSSTYQRVIPRKQEALVYTKPGRLGFEWLVSYRLKK